MPRTDTRDSEFRTFSTLEQIHYAISAAQDKDATIDELKLEIKALRRELGGANCTITGNNIVIADLLRNQTAISDNAIATESTMRAAICERRAVANNNLAKALETLEAIKLHVMNALWESEKPDADTIKRIMLAFEEGWGWVGSEADGIKIGE